MEKIKVSLLVKGNLIVKGDIIEHNNKGNVYTAVLPDDERFDMSEATIVTGDMHVDILDVHSSVIAVTGNCVAFGEVNDSGYVKKTGDTMTGQLH